MCRIGVCMTWPDANVILSQNVVDRRLMATLIDGLRYVFDSKRNYAPAAATACQMVNWRYDLPGAVA